MNDYEREAILTVAFMAAFADGNKGDQERAEIRRIGDALGAGSSINTAAIFQNVVLKKSTLDEVAKRLTTPEAKTIAYEFAVGVCDADAALSVNEKIFLNELRVSLGLAAAAVAGVTNDATMLAAAPLTGGADTSTDGGPIHGTQTHDTQTHDTQTQMAGFAATMTQAEMDKMILNYSILNGALELLPQSLASMAIIPLQIKMVYRIGKVHGFELDKGHIKDFLGTLGVGLTSQYIEQFGRKLIGGLLGSVAGGLGRAAGSAVTGSAFSFATTYALGQVAKKYYAGGRTLSSDTLKQAFSGVLGEARQLQTRYLPDIQQKARTVDITQVMKEIAQ